MPASSQEQVAADALFPDEPRLVVALGMLAAGPWDESSLRDIRDDSIDRQIGHYIDRDDMVTTVMSTFVSATVHCARCHDHKFDPISQDDYYSLQAVFAGVDKAERGYDPDPALDRLRRQLKRGAQGGRAERTRRWRPGSKAELAALPPQTPGLRRGERLRPRRQPQAAGRARGRCTSCARRHPPAGQAGRAGNAELRRTVCRRGFNLRPSDDESARRAALARWLTDPRNPLTWRSIVNRVWHCHFGRGIWSRRPTTSAGWGRCRRIPSCSTGWPRRFRDSGGSLKQLASADRHQRRLPAERRGTTRRSPRSTPTTSGSGGRTAAGSTPRSIHDAILRARRPARPDDGRALGPAVRAAARACTSRRWSTTRSTTGTAPARAGGASTASCSARCPTRSSTPSTRPTPRSSPPCATSRPRRSRPSSCLNNPFVLRQCEHFAGRLRAPSQATSTSRSRLAFELAYGRPPASEEVALLSDLRRAPRPGEPLPVIFNSNEFLFVN